MFGTQRIVNSLPINSRVRSDPSSMGFRLFSIQGEFSEAYQRDIFRVKFNQYPLTAFTDLSKDLYVWDIEDFEFTYNNEELNLYPIDPVISGDGVELEIVDSSEKLLYSFPTRLEFLSSILNYSGVVYDADLSVASTIQDIEVSGYLYIEISNVTIFYQVADSTKERSPVLRANLHIEGEDANGNELIEDLFPDRNGFYKTLNRFSKVLSLYLINVAGDDAHLTIKVLDYQIESYRSVFYTAITESQEFELLKEFDDQFFYLRYPIFPVEAGTRVTEDKETVAAIGLFDSDNAPIAITDISFIPNTEELVVLDSDKLYFFKKFLPPLFTLPSVDRTREVIATVEPLTRYPTFGEDLKCFVFTRSIFKRINFVEIKIKDPDGEEFFLNGDLEFQSTGYSFTGDLADWPGDTFPDRVFFVTPDKFGQWEFIITTQDIDGNLYVDVSCFIVASLNAHREIQLEKSYNAMSYGQDGLIYLLDGSDTDIYKPIRDVCLIASGQKRVYTLETFENLEVIYE